MRRGAALVIVGNEVLSAKVEDLNGPLAVRRLRERQVPLRWMATVPDDIDAIVEAVQIARGHADAVITSGGIGPTHDDVTVRAVSMALGRRVVRLAEIEDLLRQRARAPLTAETFRLADAPEGCELVYTPGLWYPTLSCGGVMLLPGVPKLFAAHLETVLGRLPAAPVNSRSMFVSIREEVLAASLDRVAREMPEVAFGSYPVFEPSLDYRVKLTIEHPDGQRVSAALLALEEALPKGAVVRIE